MLLDIKTRKSRGHVLWIASLIVLYVGFATAYNISVPLYEAPDEPAHIAYVDALQRTGKIPDIAESYEAVGPPLYHGTGALLLKLLGRASPGPFPMLDNDFPFHGPALSIHLLRSVSTMFGAGAVVVIYLIALMLFPDRRLLAWGAAANTALLPQFLFIGGSVMNDTAVAFFGAAAIYSILRFIKDGTTTWVALTAGSLALGFLTEGAMIVIAVVCALGLLFRPLPWKQRGFALAILMIVPLVVAGWFYVRNIVVLGDVYPESLTAGLNAGLPLSDEAYRGLFQQTLFNSYWYAGGGMTIYVVGAMYQFLQIIAGMALGGLIVLVTRKNLSSFQHRGLILLAALFLLALVEVLYVSTNLSFQPQGRFLFVAQPAIAIFLALGISALFQRSAERDSIAVLLLPAILLGLNLGVLTLTLPAAY